MVSQQDKVYLYTVYSVDCVQNEKLKKMSMKLHII